MTKVYKFSQQWVGLAIVLLCVCICNASYSEPANKIFDLDNSKRIDAGDLIEMIYSLHQGKNVPDFNEDQKFDAKDLFLFSLYWRSSVESGEIVAPLQDPSVGYDLYTASTFIYSGSAPIQLGVEIEKLDEKRVAVLRGRVIASDRKPLPGVSISIDDHAEYGQTLTRGDGMFDMVVNGGSQLTIQYTKEGFLPVERNVSVPWRDFVLPEDVVMTPLDDNVTAVDLLQTSEMQVAEGSEITDEDGTRQARLLFPAGIEAAIVTSEGQTISLDRIHVRATEYTVGPDGPNAMPAKLPPSSGYTYCVEFSVDEISDLENQEIQFSQPLFSYVENFLEFPVGGIVPSGYYDRQRNAWIPSKNGRVIKMINIDGNGQAVLDVTGSGTAAGANALAELGITSDERKTLAAIYQPGQSLWRVPITHFTPWDYNWPYAPPEDAEEPNTPPPDEEEPEEDPCESAGSVIQIQNQILGENLDLVGIPFQLNYSSGRVKGRTLPYRREIYISGDSIPASLQRIELLISVAGQRIEIVFPPQPNQNYTFIWDGKDVYGRDVQGSQQIKVRIGYVYRAVYMEPAPFEQSFARYSGVPIEGNQARQEVTLWKNWIGSIGPWDARGMGLGGWFLNEHHSYDTAGRILYMGNGRQRSVEAMDKIISTLAGRGPLDFGTGNPDFDYNMLFGDNVPANQVFLMFPQGVVAARDGSVYIAETAGNRIRKVGPDGIITTVAGQNMGASVPGGPIGDNGPAINASLSFPFGLALGPDGSLYIADSMNHRIRRVRPNGMITTVAGSGKGYDEIWLQPDIGDNGPATQANIIFPSSVAVGPDGSLYITDVGNQRIRYVSPDGVISTIAGNGDSGTDEDGTPAIEAEIDEPWGVALGLDGSVYFSDGTHRVRKIGTDGILSTVAGTGDSGYSGDGGAANQAQLNEPKGIAVGPDGSLYIADTENSCIRQISPEGIITTVAGNGGFGYSGDGGPARQAQLNNPQGVGLGMDGNLYISDTENGSIRQVSSAFPGYSIGNIGILDESGTRLFVFNSQGRHRETKDLVSSAVLLKFNYDDASGKIASIVDQHGNAVSIERNANGDPTALVGPYGQRSHLAVNSDGYLQTITSPASEVTSFSYHQDGLLASMINPMGNQWKFDYDTHGRLIRDEDPTGESILLERSEKATGHEVSLRYSSGSQTVFSYESLPAGDIKKTVIHPSGARTESLLKTDGIERTILPDGTLFQRTGNVDNCPCADATGSESLTITTPSGLTATLISHRSIRLATPDDPTSLISLTDRLISNDRVYTTTYEVESRSIVRLSPEGRQRMTRMDEQGQVTEVYFDINYDPLLLAFNNQGFVTSAQAGDEVMRYQYDEKGRLEAFINADEHSIRYEYDSADRLTKVTLPSGRDYRYRYDRAGNVDSMLMPNGTEYTFGYSPVNLVESYLESENVLLRFLNDPLKRSTGTVFPSGRAVNITYDNGDRITGIVYPEAEILYLYEDQTDRPVSVTRTPKDGGISQNLSFTYDGSLVTKTSWAGIANGDYHYRYDNSFRLESFILDNSPEVALHYDRDGLVVKQGPFTISRNGPQGMPDRIFDDNMIIEFDYDRSGRFKRRTHAVKGDVLYDVQLIYDNIGRISQKHENVNGVSFSYRYTYDQDGQLTEVQSDETVVEQYAYDVNGNRSARRTGAMTEQLVYDSSDRLISRGSVVYGWNQDGFLVQRDQASFSYSAQGELIQALLPNNQNITYGYDGFGRCVSRTDDQGTIQYLYGDLQHPFLLTASRDRSGILTIYYYDSSNQLFALQRGDAWYYVATDSLGTPKVICDANGLVVKTVNTDSFGLLLEEDPLGFDLAIGFAGGLSDTKTGLVRFAARDYETSSGRWTARDPLLFGGSEFNLYTYVDNDPINWYDPLGMNKAPKPGSAGKEWKQFNDEAKKRGDDSAKPFCEKLKDVWNRVIDALGGGEGK